MDASATTSTTTTDLSASALNTRYGQANRRFDYRASKLRALGFTYQHVEIDDPKCTIAVFVLRRPGITSHVIQASAVMYADSVFWACIYADAVIARG